MRRIVPLALAAAITSLAAVSSAVAQPAYPFGVIEGPGGTIGSERIAIRKRYLREPAIGRFVLELTLDEMQTDGDEIFLGSQQVALADAILFVEGAPTARYALVDVDWATGPLEANSEVRACLQLYRVRFDGRLTPQGDVECRVLVPVDL